MSESVIHGFIASSAAIAVRAVRCDTQFEQKLQALQMTFLQARDHLLLQLKDDLNDATNFVKFVVKAMQILKDVEMKSYERQDMIIDLVQSVVETMPIDNAEKEEIRRRCYPAIVSIVAILAASAKGYLYIQHGIENAEVAVAGCFKKVTHTKTKHRSKDLPAGSINMEATILEIYHTISTAIAHKQFSLSNIIPIGSSIMQIVEEYPQLSGTQKKEVVISVMHKLINNSSLEEDVKFILNLVVDTVLTKVIDFVVSAARGEIELVNIVAAKVKAGCVKTVCQ